jgi:hypothetical protein
MKKAFPSVTIRTNGYRTVAELFYGDEKIAKGVAKCSPEDKFDFSIGAKLALDRMIDDQQNPHKLLKTGVFGVSNRYGAFVVVDDMMVYQNGGFDYIADYNDNLRCIIGTYCIAEITAIYPDSVCGFAQIKTAVPIWTRV